VEEVVVAKREARRLRFKCVRCHCVRDVDVDVDGAGLSIIGRDEKAAVRTASRKADDALAANAATMLALVRCPSCRHRSTLALVSLFLWSTIPALILGAIAADLAVIGGLAFVLACPVGIAAVVLPMLGYRSLARAERHVTFLEP
jgi:hypothetical protein